MHKTGLNINKINSFLLIGASSLVISACVPEDETGNLENDTRHVEAMATTYAQAFEHYSSQALNAVVNSAAWQAQILPEGSIDLTDMQFGSLNLGEAESYLQSAHCNVAGESYHITWFDKSDGNGVLFLKGLGNKQSGLVSLKVKKLIPNSNLGIMGSTSIEMVESGTTLSLGGACNTINIPEGSAVAAIRIPEPVRVSEVQEKLITRAMPCGEGEEGGVLQRVNATFTDTGTIIVQDQGFGSEADVIADNGLTWDEISNECIALNESITRVASSTSVDAVNMASLAGVSGGIANTLRSNLNNLECKDVKKSDDPKENEDSKNKEFDTCANAGDLDLLESMNVTDTLIRTEETIIAQACPAEEIPTTGSVRVVTSNNDFRGVHRALNGKQGELSADTMTGELKLKKITRFYEVMNDYGGEGDRQVSEATVISHEGVDIQCQRVNGLALTCQQMYTGFGSDTSISGVGISYERPSEMSGWSDAQNLVPNPMSYTGAWQQNNSMRCNFVQRRETYRACELGSGGITTSYVRTALTTQPGQSPNWGEWSRIGTSGNCPCGGGCFAEGALVLMNDGTSKAIQDIVVGDETATGRVLLTVCNTINTPNETKNISDHTEDDLYLMDGIKVTGNHVVLDKGQWKQTIDSENASPHFENNVFNTFNLMTENGIIPVLGQSGHVHYFADARNNKNAESIRGMIKAPLNLSVSA